MRRGAELSPTRRDFLRASTAAAALSRMPLRAAGAWEPRVAENIGSLDDATLTWLAQLGHKWVVLQGTDSVDRDNKGYWSLEDIRAVQGRCRAFGLELHSLMIPLSWLRNAMLGRSERDRDIANIVRSIGAGGEAGVSVFEWRWSPDFQWGVEAGYRDVAGRGGALYKSFDYSLVKDKPPFEDLGPITKDQLRERLEYFCGPVMKAAEKAGVRLSLHPKDPPVPVMRGIERLLTRTGDIENFLDLVPSPASGFTFCQGTVTEMGVDVIDAIRRIGARKRIHHIHFRAVRGKVPNYTEVFIDEGDVDMLAAMRAYRDAGYTDALVSDHTPKVTGEIDGGRIGRSFSQGYIRGLVQAVNAGHGVKPRSAPKGPRLKIADGVRDLSDETLGFYRQMGVQHVAMPSGYSVNASKRPLVPPADFGPKPGQVFKPWRAEDLVRVRQRIESVGMKAEMVHLGGFHRIVHGRPGRDEEMENVKKSIRAAGQAGVPVIEYNFTPLRGSEGYGSATGRGNAGLRDFDHDRVRDLPPLENVGVHTREQMWERLEAFLKEVVPVAEQARVRLAVHPNDPPIPVFRGAAQPLRTLADLRRLIETVDSPSNGITLDTGVTTEMGEDAAEAIRYFGSRDRINHVHFRNVRVQTPYYKYLEVFHDQGECDMLACMKAFQEVRYPRLIIPDHTPAFTGDNIRSQMGWAFALGYLHALRHAAEGA